MEKPFDRQGWALDLVIVVALQLGVCVAAKIAGVTAISDDDFARVVIAQQFVEGPSLDPSGTSWLPLPFLIQGVAMQLTQPSLAVARIVSVLMACGGAMLLYAAARTIGTPGRFAILSSFLGASLPHSAFLGVCTVPEYPSACFLLFGATSLHPRAGPKAQLGGVLCILAACASRYEAWPAAFAVSVVHLGRVLHSKAKSRHLGLAGLSLAFPLLWFTHGFVNHGDPLFFVKRVVDYKLALGREAPGIGMLLVGYPRALILAEPEIVLALVGAVVATRWNTQSPRSEHELASSDALRALAAPSAILLVVLLSLVLGDARGGAPTHHPERALVSLWLFAATCVGHLASQTQAQEARKYWAVIVIFGLTGQVVRHSELFEREAFVDRSTEEEFGSRIAQLLGREEKLALIMPDYGYFALMAAAQDPARLEIPLKHDPRSPSVEVSLPETVKNWRQKGGCHYATRRDAAVKGDTLLLEHGTLALFRSAECRTRLN